MSIMLFTRGANYSAFTGKNKINIDSILDRWTLTRGGRTWRPGEYSLKFSTGIYRSVFETLDLFQAEMDEFATSFQTVSLWTKSCIKDEVR